MPLPLARQIGSNFAGVAHFVNVYDFRLFGGEEVFLAARVVAAEQAAIRHLLDALAWPPAERAGDSRCTESSATHTQQ